MPLANKVTVHPILTFTDFQVEQVSVTRSVEFMAEHMNTINPETVLSKSHVSPPASTHKKIIEQMHDTTIVSMVLLFGDSEEIFAANKFLTEKMEQDITRLADYRYGHEIAKFLGELGTKNKVTQFTMLLVTSNGTFYSWFPSDLRYGNVVRPVTSESSTTSSFVVERLRHIQDYEYSGFSAKQLAIAYGESVDWELGITLRGEIFRLCNVKLNK